MKVVKQTYWNKSLKISKVPICKQRNDDNKIGGNAEYHEGRLKHLFPKMSGEDAKRLAKDLAD